MTDLIAIHYDDPVRAERVRSELFELQKRHLIEFDDALVVEREASGNVKLDQLHDLTLAGALNGGFWGLLLGAIFTIPFFGAGVVALPFVSSLLGAGVGAVSGSLADIGVDDDFARKCGEAFVPGTSALFVLIRKVTPDKVIEAIRPYGGTLLTTSLTRAQEARIHEMLTPIHDQYEAAHHDPTSRASRPST